MDSGQQPIEPKFFVCATQRQRIVSACIFLGIASVFLIGWLMGHYHFSIYPFSCGFKQQYGLPCPTCGMTTAVIAFAEGRIIDAFHAQPAAAVFCCLAAATAFFALLIAVFGVYSPVLERRLASLKWRYIIAGSLFIFIIGWAITLSRALAQKGNH